MRASIYGDPDFPISVMAKTRLSPISIFKDLYKTFSRLEFTRVSDRPLAIRGLERRLFRELGCEGRHGILFRGQVPLGHSLLWRRATEIGMRRIEPPPGSIHPPPSWSWMAYTGEISYLDIRLDEVDWDQSLSSNQDGEGNLTALSVSGWDFDQGEIREVCYDRPQDAIREGQKCVIMGRSKRANTTPATFPLLLIAASENEGTWMRFGVALAEEKASGNGLSLSNRLHVFLH